MDFIVKVLTLSVVLLVSEIECQSLLSGLQGLDRQSPVIGACDRIASRGVMNCMENFLPSRTLSGLTGGQANSRVCCNYSKYKACVTGLHDGLRIAMERERCPKSYSTRIIRSLGDSLVGLPLQTMCQSVDGSKCRRTTNKKKSNRNSPRRTSVDESTSVLEPALQPARGILQQGRRLGSEDPTSILNPVLQPVRGIFGGRRRDSDESTSVLEPAIQPFRGILGQTPKRRTGSEESTSILDPLLQPVRSIFGQNPKRKRDSDESPSVLEPAIQPFRDILGQTPKRRTGSEESTSILDPVLQPVRSIFGQFPKSRSSSDEPSSILDPVLNPIRGVFGRFSLL